MPAFTSLFWIFCAGITKFLEFYAHPGSSLTIFCSVDVWHPPQAPLQHVGRGSPPQRKSPTKCRFRFICRGRALPAIIPISRIPRKNAQKRLPSLKVAKKRLAAFCKAFVVHHVGANPNTFVYPGGIGIIRLLTRKWCLLFLRARIKEGCWNIKGLLRHILALQTGLRYSTVPLTFPHPSFLG